MLLSVRSLLMQYLAFAFPRNCVHAERNCTLQGLDEAAAATADVAVADCFEGK